MALSITRVATNELTEEQSGQSVFYIDTSLGTIKVELKKIRGKYIDVDIEAPKSYTIVREELLFADA